MKSPIMLVCAMMLAMGVSVLAEEKAAVAGGEQKQVQAEKKPHGPKDEARMEAMMTKQLEAIKAKDEALYKELVALRETDVKAFRAKMRELADNNLLERIKAKDEALYKELIALKDSDPKAFRKKLHEVAKQYGPANGGRQGKKQGKAKAAAEK